MGREIDNGAGGDPWPLHDLTVDAGDVDGALADEHSPGEDIVSAHCRYVVTGSDGTISIDTEPGSRTEQEIIDDVCECLGL